MNTLFRRNRRGITSAIAMIFLVLIGLMAMGFYALTTTATTLSRNDRRTAKSLLAAESGIQFMRNRLAHVTIPPNTSAANLLSELEADLKADAYIAGNIGSAAITRAGNVITIPFICTDAEENGGFVVTLTDIGAVGEIVCAVKGRVGSGASVSQKGVRLDFSRKSIDISVFDYAAAARGRFNMQKGSITGITGVSSDAIIKVMSAQTTNPAISMTGGTIGSAAGGELGVVIDGNADGKADAAATAISAGSVHGTTNITSIKTNYVKLVAQPEFPVVDTEQFRAYATSPYVAGETTLKNVFIPAGTNPQFNGAVTIQGILYIESPNVVDFRGATHMEGFIVVQKANDSTQNIINATGNFTHGNLPSDAQFDPLRAIKGISILAPTTSLRISGSVDSQISGNLIVGNFQSAGSADIAIEKGSIITLDSGASSAVLNGKNIKFASTGAANEPPPGVYFTTKFLPADGSYMELN
jgi:Tfp pilus assembly protein PilX